MLELKNIVKDYVSGNNVTHALKGISVNFRKNEFVSILGASGCGKTTTLNIIGGLDRYTSGDLLINGKSTKDYTDRDWDTYRNHSIGFIFQTYNLIAHQNILKNVELALTISGVDKDERKRRAYEALKKVGLEGMEKKKPNQLSGGQCQRVAIARALINNPEILLADEPTGALDSETSVQIMDLLKEVASDRLVIMVTHNPELAEKYSTRIVRMSDGLIVGDSQPFDGKEEVQGVEVVSKGKKKKSSMSLLTSMGLSLSNLVSKMRRTVLVTIAGSIGIIGVSAVLAVSQGVKDYIKEMQNDMLSSYPLTIAEESVDYTSLMSGLSANQNKIKFEFDPENPKIGVDSMIDYLMTAYSDFTKVKTNTIDKSLLAYIDEIPEEGVAAKFLNYGIDVTNNIFGSWQQEDGKDPVEYSLNGLIQSYIAELKTVKGFDEYATYVNLFTNFMNQMPDSKKYVMDQYELIAGEEPTFADDELIFVVDKDTTLTDLTLAEMGVYNHDEFLKIAKKAIKEQEVNADESLTPEEKKTKLDEIAEKYKYSTEFEYSDLLNRTYKYFPQNTIYKNGVVAAPQVGVSCDVVDFVGMQMFSLSYNESKDTWSGTLTNTSNFLSPTKLEFSRVGATPDTFESNVEKAQGMWTATDEEDTYSVVLNNDLPAVMVTINEDAPVAFINMNGEKNVYPKTIEVEGYYYEAQQQPEWGQGKEMKVKSILRLKKDRNFGCLSRGVYYSKAFADLYMNDSKDSILTNALQDFIGSEEELTQQFQAYVKFNFIDQTDETNPTLSSGYASALNGDLSSSFSDLFSGLMGINYMETDMVHLRSIAGKKTVLVYNEETDEVDDIYFDNVPQNISIYPKSFASKDIATNHLDKWNSDETLTVNLDGVQTEVFAKDRAELTYTDTIQIIVTVINTLIDAITISLVVFTSLSLVVSCFMIAVITYISVVERIKEIGVIRSLGGRKGDVASLFVMETLLTGLFSGVFGIAITYVLQIILNILLVAKFGIAIANLTIGTAAIMIGVSVALSVVSGLIPSQTAAHKDPVVALRTGE